MNAWACSSSVIVIVSNFVINLHQFYWLACKSRWYFCSCNKKITREYAKIKLHLFIFLFCKIYYITLHWPWPKNWTARVLWIYIFIAKLTVQLWTADFPGGKAANPNTKNSINQVWYVEYQTWNYITFHYGFPFFQNRENGKKPNLFKYKSKHVFSSKY